MSMEGMACCGFDEYHGVNDRGAQPMSILREIMEYKNDGDYGAHIVFTEVTRWKKVDWGHSGDPSCMRELARIIDVNRLGPLVSSTAKINPNSGNTVRGHIWTPSYTVLHKFLMDNDARYRQDRQDIAEENRRWGGHW